MARGDRADLRSRLMAEGFDYLVAARANELLDEAAEEVTSERQWPARILSSSVVPPLVDAVGIDRVFTVRDDVSGVTLEEVTRAYLKRTGHDLTQTGQPVYWYFTTTGSIQTWPVATTSVTFEYLTLKVWAAGGGAAANDTDTPLVGADVRQAIVYVAKAKAHEEKSRSDLSQSSRALADQVIERAFAARSRQVTQRFVRVVE